MLAKVGTESPLEVLLRVMHTAEDQATRLKAAGLAAPYCHARLTADVGGHLAAQGDEPSVSRSRYLKTRATARTCGTCSRRPTATATKPRREMMTRFDDDDDREVLRDGERLRVSIHVQDAMWRREVDLIEHDTRMDLLERRVLERRAARDAQHKPGYRTAGDHFAQDRREQARDAYIERLQNAWKTPARVAADH